MIAFALHAHNGANDLLLRGVGSCGGISGFGPVRARVGRLLARRQLEPGDDSAPRDPLSETSPVLAGLVTLQMVWRDGSSHRLVESIELLEKLAATTPRPAINLVRYNGVLAPPAR